MFVVAVVAIAMATVGEAIRELKLARRYRVLASGYRVVEAINSGHRVILPVGMIGEGACNPSPRLAAYYSELKRKNERAASRPWLPVEPDPPTPNP
jgi:hypothetical protein